MSSADRKGPINYVESFKVEAGGGGVGAKKGPWSMKSGLWPPVSFCVLFNIQIETNFEEYWI